MDPENFITFAESIRASDDTGNAGKAQTFFSAAIFGYHGASYGPPSEMENLDNPAQKGFHFGKQLRKRFK